MKNMKNDLKLTLKKNMKEHDKHEEESKANMEEEYEGT